MLAITIAMGGGLIGFGWIKGREATVEAANRLMDANIATIVECQRGKLGQIDLFVCVSALGQRFTDPFPAPDSPPARLLPAALEEIDATESSRLPPGNRFNGPCA